MTKERPPQPVGWLRACRYPDPAIARETYEAARDLLLTTDLDASAFRFTIGGTSFVAVLGEVPLDPERAREVRALLEARGELTDVPAFAVRELRRRRRGFKKMGVDFFERRAGET